MSRFVSGKIVEVQQCIESGPIDKRGMSTTNINTVVKLDNGKDYNIEGGELNLISGKKIGFYLKPKSNVVESIIRNRIAEKELLKINYGSITRISFGVFMTISFISLLIYGVMNFISTGEISNIAIPISFSLIFSPAIYYIFAEGFEDKLSKSDKENINNYLYEMEKTEDKEDILFEPKQNKNECLIQN